MGPLRTCAFFVSVIAGVSTMYFTLSVNTYICASLHISLCVLFVCYMRMIWTCRCPATDCWPKQTVCLIWAVVPWEFAGVELQTTPPGDKRLSLLSTGAIPVGKDGLNSFQWKAAGALWCPERVVQEGARDVLDAPGLCTNPDPRPVKPVFSPQCEPEIWSSSAVKLLLLLHFHLVL